MKRYDPDFKEWEDDIDIFMTEYKNGEYFKCSEVFEEIDKIINETAPGFSVRKRYDDTGLLLLKQRLQEVEK